jgi:hypothetical protein
LVISTETKAEAEPTAKSTRSRLPAVVVEMECETIVINGSREPCL